jgi:hypothetical protein
MADILANPVEICFGYFTATLTTLVVVTSLTASMKALVMPNACPSSSKKSKTHPPKPYDIVQGMERVIDIMEETLQICERAQHSTQDASHSQTFRFGLRPSSDAHTFRRRSRSRSNLGDSNHLATRRSKLTPVVTH